MHDRLDVLYTGFEIEEIEALYTYCMRNPSGLDQKKLDAFRDQMNKFRVLLGKLNNGDAAQADSLKEELRKLGNDLAGSYQLLNREVFEKSAITGKSLRDSKDVSGATRGVYAYLIISFVLAVALEIFDIFITDQPDIHEGSYLFFFLEYYIFDFISPVFWGALGASLYLTKRIYDEIQNLSFNRDYLGGWQVRIWLGATLAVVVYHIYDPSDSLSQQISGNALALLTGVGVKVFYGAIERTVNALGRAIDVESLRPGRTRTPPPRGGNGAGQ